MISTVSAPAAARSALVRRAGDGCGNGRSRDLAGLDLVIPAPRVGPAARLQHGHVAVEMFVDRVGVGDEHAAVAREHLVHRRAVVLRRVAEEHVTLRRHHYEEVAANPNTVQQPAEVAPQLWRHVHQQVAGVIGPSARAGGDVRTRNRTPRLALGKPYDNTVYLSGLMFPKSMNNAPLRNRD